MIREAISEDIPTLLRMGRRFLLEGPYRDHIMDNPEQCRKLTEGLLANPQAKVLIAEEQGKPAGLLIFLLFPHYFSGEITAGEVVWYVEPESRGKLAGLKLLNAAEKLARSLGAKRMQFVAPTERMERLYERLGFQKVETTYQRSLQ